MKGSISLYEKLIKHDRHMYICIRTYDYDFGYIIIHSMVEICEEYLFLKIFHSKVFFYLFTYSLTIWGYLRY